MIKKILSVPFVLNNAFLSFNTVTAWVTNVYTGKSYWILKMDGEFQGGLAVWLYCFSLVALVVIWRKELKLEL